MILQTRYFNKSLFNMRKQTVKPQNFLNKALHFLIYARISSLPVR
jgi:hypothetical protein